MWLRAVSVIPRLDKDAWDRLDPVARWLVAVRAAVLVMTVLAAGLAGLLAVRDRAFDGLRFGLVLVGLVLAHATNNLVNDLTDHAKGLDRGDSFRARYGPQPLEHGLLTPRQAWGYVAVTGGVALACGVVLVAMRGGATAWLLLAGIFFVLAYTWPLKHLGLGEPAVLLVWGPLMARRRCRRPKGRRRCRRPKGRCPTPPTAPGVRPWCRRCLRPPRTRAPTPARRPKVRP
jgi:1,4-dihydroxy-2-naphthoate octaprenyltransferase